MESTTRTTFQVGDLVVINAMYARRGQEDQVYKVTKLLPVNVQIQPVVGGRGIIIHPSGLQPAPADRVTQVTEVGVPYMPMLYAGTVVTVSGPGWRQSTTDLYVVLTEKVDGKVKIVKLGGEDGRYWPGIPRTYLTVVDPATIKHLGSD